VFLRVELGDETWFTDVGVGARSLTSALRFADGPQETPHETRRIIREDGKYFHQALLDDTWSDICEFTLEEMPAIDRELGNWFTSAHPDSPFKNRLIVARAASDGARITLLNDELRHRDPQGQARVTKLTTKAELLNALSTEFGLEFPAETRFGAAGSAWPT